MKFTAIDVEIANPDMASICAIGAATFENGQLSSEWYSLLNPGDYFHPMNVAIHGIDKSMISGAPTYKKVSGTIERLVGDTVVVTHTHFDRVAMHQAAHRWDVKPLCCTWLDSARVVRRTWEECAQSGYGLADICKRIGYDFQHHHALEDAKAAGQVLVAAMEKTGLDLDGMLRRVGQPINPSKARSRSAIKREGNPDGPLFGEVIVFTGGVGMPRSAAADLAAAAGCEVAAGVTKKTTILVVGDVDVKFLAGHEKSSKHRKAEKLITQGFPIRIVRASDFHQLIEMT